MMKCRRRWSWFLLAVQLLVVSTCALAQGSGPYVGRTVQSVIDELRAAGLPLAYSTVLLPDSLLVEREPSARDPLELARQLLEPHGLTLRQSGGAWLVVRAEVSAVLPSGLVVTVVSGVTGDAVAEATLEVDPPSGPTTVAASGRAELEGLTAGKHTLLVRAPGFLPERLSIDLAAGANADVTAALTEAAPKLEVLTVTASRYDLINDVQPSTAAFSRDQIESLALLGEDTVRVAQRLPGIAASEFSARSHIRGGAADEMAVMLDGMRLIEPFHLRDYQSLFSVIDQRIVSGLQIYSGGFPPEYGNALSGLMVIDSREPTRLAHEIGLSVLHTSLLSTGTFRDGRASWLASARRSNLGDVMKRSLGEPAYHDIFARVGLDIGAKHRLTLNSLGYDDDIVLTPSDSPDDQQTADSQSDNEQRWLTLDSVWSENLSSRTWIYSSHFDSIRNESVRDLAEIDGTVLDNREFDEVGIRQQWRFEPSDRQLFGWGFEAEELDGSFDYSSSVQRFGLLATLGGLAPPQRNESLDAHGDNYSVYFNDRIRATDRLIAELGLRWDRQSYDGSGAYDQYSPRLSMLYRLSSRTNLRASYGRFFQAPEMLALQVEDGVTTFAPAQDATHSIIGLEHRFDGQLALRVEAFRKLIRDPQPRFENYFDPLVLMPELRSSRTRIAPERAEAHGLEVFVSGGDRLPWWAGYSISRVDDIVDGVRVRRSWDQRYALDAGVTWDVGAWSLSFVASVHSGWPATDLHVETVNGQSVVVAGARNATHLGPLRRIDFRASKDFAIRVGSLRFFADVTNLTDRRNPCCRSYEPGTDAGGAAVLAPEDRAGLPLTGNLGVLWAF